MHSVPLFKVFRPLLSGLTFRFHVSSKVLVTSWSVLPLGALEVTFVFSGGWFFVHTLKGQSINRILSVLTFRRVSSICGSWGWFLLFWLLLYCDWTSLIGTIMDFSVLLYNHPISKLWLLQWDSVRYAERIHMQYRFQSRKIPCRREALFLFTILS